MITCELFDTFPFSCFRHSEREDCLTTIKKNNTAQFLVWMEKLTGDYQSQITNQNKPDKV